MQSRRDADSPDGRCQGTPASSPGGGFTPAPLRGAQRDRASPTAKKRGDGLERRSPTGIARERETSADAQLAARSRIANGEKARGLERRSPTGIARERETSAAARRAARSRIANREEARGRPGAPVSDRHRAGARNQRRCATRSEIAHRQPRRSAGTAWSAGLRPASRGSAKPAPMTPRYANVSAAPSPRTGCRDRSPLLLSRLRPATAPVGVVCYNYDLYIQTEARYISVGEVDGVAIIVVAHTKRSGRIRLISARPASRKERQAWYEHLR